MSACFKRNAWARPTSSATEAPAIHPSTIRKCRSKAVARRRRYLKQESQAALRLAVKPAGTIGHEARTLRSETASWDLLNHSRADRLVNLSSPAEHPVSSWKSTFASTRAIARWFADTRSISANLASPPCSCRKSPSTRSCASNSPCLRGKSKFSLWCASAAPSVTASNSSKVARRGISSAGRAEISLSNNRSPSHFLTSLISRDTNPRGNT